MTPDTKRATGSRKTASSRRAARPRRARRAAPASRAGATLAAKSESVWCASIWPLAHTYAASHAHGRGEPPRASGLATRLGQPRGGLLLQRGVERCITVSLPTLWNLSRIGTVQFSRWLCGCRLEIGLEAVRARLLSVSFLVAARLSFRPFRARPENVPHE